MARSPIKKFSTPRAVVETYFKAVKSSDLKLLRSIFADNMELISQTVGLMKGGARITEFYGKLLKRMGGARPHPGPIMVFGDTAVIEIDAHHGPEVHKVSDFFTVKRGKVVRLAIYQGPIHPKGGKLTDFTRKKVKWPKPRA